MCRPPQRLQAIAARNPGAALPHLDAYDEFRKACDRRLGGPDVEQALDQALTHRERCESNRRDVKEAKDPGPRLIDDQLTKALDRVRACVARADDRCDSGWGTHLVRRYCERTDPGVHVSMDVDQPWNDQCT